MVWWCRFCCVTSGEHEHCHDDTLQMTLNSYQLCDSRIDQQHCWRYGVASTQGIWTDWWRWPVRVLVCGQSCVVWATSCASWGQGSPCWWKPAKWYASSRFWDGSQSNLQLSRTNVRSFAQTLFPLAWERLFCSPDYDYVQDIRDQRRNNPDAEDHIQCNNYSFESRSGSQFLRGFQGTGKNTQMAIFCRCVLQRSGGRPNPWSWESHQRTQARVGILQKAVDAPFLHHMDLAQLVCPGLYCPDKFDLLA